MFLRQATPFDFVSRERSLSPKTALVVTISVGVHALVAAYLAMLQFAPPQSTVVAETPPIVVDVLTLPKTDPQPEASTPPRNTPQFHRSTIQDFPTSTPPLQISRCERTTLHARSRLHPLPATESGRRDPGPRDS